MKNSSSAELATLMQLTATLLNNDSLMNSINGKGRKSHTSSGTTVTEENVELSSLSEKLDNMAKEISELKKEKKRRNTQ